MTAYDEYKIHRVFSCAQRLAMLIRKGRELKGWMKRYKMAEESRTIDFGCEIKNGVCKTRPEAPPSRLCCGNCAQCVGHFDSYHDALPLTALIPLLDSFDAEDGWWREGKGCIMPVKWRSNTCLFYACYCKEKERKNHLRVAHENALKPREEE